MSINNDIQIENNNNLKEENKIKKIIQPKQKNELENINKQIKNSELKNEILNNINSQIQCTVMVIYSFSKITHTSIINTHKKTKNTILLNDIITQLEKEIPLENFQILYYNEIEKNYILIGKYPLNKEKEILFKYNSNKIINDNIFIKIKLRQILERENLLKMEFIEGENDIGEEAIQKFEIGENNKTKRAKERKIGYIIRKVYINFRRSC